MRKLWWLGINAPQTLPPPPSRNSPLALNSGKMRAPSGCTHMSPVASVINDMLTQRGCVASDVSCIAPMARRVVGACSASGPYMGSAYLVVHADTVPGAFYACRSTQRHQTCVFHAIHNITNRMDAFVKAMFATCLRRRPSWMRLREFRFTLRRQRPSATSPPR
ncbi:Hypothetical protein, putative [Bodo saltans]|uniref:Uncharacterized protein n=1 Tax=Bodo saltans TaxID=75058 RepID=A0A0S4IL89_BODSA|nr:Hypothetical protein, putative [Bodo saltans]|eukprot:CUE70683.1 Hypothetical protein, putative [Bodo saltans]